MDQLPTAAREYLIFQQTLWDVSTGLARDEIVGIVLALGLMGGGVARNIHITFAIYTIASTAWAGFELISALERFQAAVPS